MWCQTFDLGQTLIECLPEARTILRLPFKQALHARLLLSRTGMRMAQQKARRGRPPGFGIILSSILL
jgi:hypothetical protein